MLFLLNGCVTETSHEKSTINVITTGNINDIVSNKKYFSWHPKVNANYLNSVLNEKNTEQKFTSSLIKELEQKGYIYTSDTTQADFYIGYGLGVDTKITDQQILNKTGLNTGLQPSTISDENKASVFIAIYLINQPLSQWTVLAQGYTDTDNERQNAIDELLKFMFSSLKNTD